MYKLKLIKGRSYSGAVNATAENPFIDVFDKKLSVRLIETGRFILTGTENPVTAGENNKDGGGVELDRFTDKQLAEYAAENGIDLTGLTKKADKLDKIRRTIDDNYGNKVDFDEIK